jgi:hypothetical protein
MRKRGFAAVRLALFAKSYAGHYFIEYIKEADDSDIIIKRLSKTLLFKEAFLAYFLSPKYSKREVSRIIKETADDKDKDKIKIYLQIEKQLILLIQDRKLKESYVTEEYEYALLSPAIERVVGNSLTNIKDDGNFEIKFVERKRLYTQSYYAVACKYRLPTLRIIPFISRLLKM